MRYTREEILEHREAWVRELETTEKKQGRGRLCGQLEDGSKEYCCLGVACELVPGIGMSPFGPSIRLGTIKFGEYGDTATLPPEAQEYYGLTERPRVRGYYLDFMNDRGDSFKEIARSIRKFGFEE